MELVPGNVLPNYGFDEVKNLVDEGIADTQSVMYLYPYMDTHIHTCPRRAGIVFGRTDTWVGAGTLLLVQVQHLGKVSIELSKEKVEKWLRH